MMIMGATMEEAAQRARAAYAAFQQQDYGAIDGLFATTGLWHEPPRASGLDSVCDAALAPVHPAGDPLDPARPLGR